MNLDIKKDKRNIKTFCTFQNPEHENSKLC